VKAEYINPFVSAAVDVFSTMLQCQLVRGELSLNVNFQPAHDISGIIGLSGKASGTVIVSVDREVALSATEKMLGERPSDINTDVIDAIGEVTNMIAGRAKVGLAQLQMSLALPTVITGTNHTIRFGSNAQTICIPYTCPWGKLSVEVGMVEAPAEAKLVVATHREGAQLVGAK
jgi:chemotaxis protein CheX